MNLGKSACTLQRWLDKTRALDFTAPLLLRTYLVYVFWQTGLEKLLNIADTAAWFGNPDWGLGLPFPLLLAYLTALAETGGAIAFALGLAVRWATIPLMIVMVVASLTVHIENGWLVIAGYGSEAQERLSTYLEQLSNTQPGIYQHLTELGQPVILNNGIEFAATYFIMLLTLFFIGGGRFVSLDYWIKRYCDKRCARES